MKLFLKILFFIFALSITTAGEAKSSTVVNVLQVETSPSCSNEGQNAFLSHPVTQMYISQAVSPVVSGGVAALGRYLYSAGANLLAKWGITVAKGGTKLLNQFNSVESLIQGAGKLERLSGGVRQGFVKGNADAIFKSITNGGTVLPSGAVRMSDGTVIRLYNATSTGAPSIFINTSSQFYKIRITP